jgi:signal transduction histidine kinase
MAIDGYAAFIESNPDDPKVGAMATTIRGYTDTLKGIAERTATIRTLIRLIEGRDTSDPMPLANTEAIVDQYREQYTDAVIESDIVDDEAIKVRYGAVFNIVLEELIENAIEHNDQATPQITIATTATPEANKAHIEIADNGPGIPRAEWEVIRSGQETQLNHTQAVGLWVVYWAITALGGVVELTENDPRGSIITVEVPLL